MVHRLELGQSELASLAGKLGCHIGMQRKGGGRVSAAVEGLAGLEQEPELAGDHGEGVTGRLVFEQAVEQRQGASPVPGAKCIDHGEYIALSVVRCKSLDVFLPDRPSAGDVVEELGG